MLNPGHILSATLTATSASTNRREERSLCSLHPRSGEQGAVSSAGRMGGGLGYEEIGANILY